MSNTHFTFCSECGTNYPADSDHVCEPPTNAMTADAMTRAEIEAFRHKLLTDAPTDPLQQVRQFGMLVALAVKVCDVALSAPQTQPAQDGDVNLAEMHAEATIHKIRSALQPAQISDVKLAEDFLLIAAIIAPNPHAVAALDRIRAVLSQSRPAGKVVQEAIARIVRKGDDYASDNGCYDVSCNAWTFTDEGSAYLEGLDAAADILRSMLPPTPDTQPEKKS